jgi:hypothetical protein
LRCGKLAAKGGVPKWYSLRITPFWAISMRQCQMLFGIDPVQAGAHDGDRGDALAVCTGALQGTCVGRRVNAQRHARDHCEACLRQCLCEATRVAGTLPGGVAAANDGNTCGLGPVQPGAAIRQLFPRGCCTHAVQNDGRVFQFQKTTRVGRITQGQHAPPLRVHGEPIQGGARQVLASWRRLRPAPVPAPH